MNKYISSLVVTGILILTACNNKPFVKHKLSFQKMSYGCEKQTGYFRMNSNFGGERFEFEKCLPSDFSSDQVTSARKGDTVVVKFIPVKKEQPENVYAIILDIDSGPEYNYITIDDDTYQITHSKLSQ